MYKNYEKNGVTVVFREAEGSDSQEVVDFYNALGGESDFLSFAENEFPATVEAEEKAIEVMKKSISEIMLLALVDNKIIGIGTINSSPKNRLKHVGTFGIGIQEKYCNIGLGSYMLESIIDWAKNNGQTKKISLLTREDNKRGYRVYEKFGFEVEGVMKKDNFEKGEYFNTISMALLFI